MGRIVYREKSLVTVVDVILVSVSYVHVIHFFFLLKFKTIKKLYDLCYIYEYMIILCILFLMRK